MGFIVSVAFVPLIVCVTVSRSIKRIIFNSLIKPNINDKGEKHMETISTSQALQIAGRAGRCVPFLLPRSVQERFRHVCIPRGNVLTQSSVSPSPRFSSKFKEGEVTTMHRDDLPILKEILSHSVDPIEVIYFTQTHSPEP